MARKVAVITRALLSEQVGRVDRAVAAAIRGHAPSTVLEIARAKVIEADPETHRAERERSRHQRYVTLSRADEYGYRHFIARVTAGDAAWIDAMVDRVADILRTTMGHDHNHDELRSLALGWLARPADLLKLLLEHTEPDTDPETGATVQPAWAPDHMAETLSKLCALPARRLARLRNPGRLFVHVTDEALRTGTGVARIEGVGPSDVTQLHEVLGNADVTVTPVLDLRMRRRVDAYEHPEIVKDHVWTQTGGNCFPFSPRTATRDGVDYDHASSYDDTGPPGQTGPHNSGPLRRGHHRTKTHGGYTTASPDPAATSGPLPTDAPTSSTTPAPTPSPTTKPTSWPRLRTASRSTGPRPGWTISRRDQRRASTASNVPSRKGSWPASAWTKANLSSVVAVGGEL